MTRMRVSMKTIKKKSEHCYCRWLDYELGTRGTEHDHKLDSRTQPVGLS